MNLESHNSGAWSMEPQVVLHQNQPSVEVGEGRFVGVSVSPTGNTREGGEEHQPHGR
jgi:hypothetical protein